MEEVGVRLHPAVAVMLAHPFDARSSAGVFISVEFRSRVVARDLATGFLTATNLWTILDNTKQSIPNSIYSNSLLTMITFLTYVVLDHDRVELASHLLLACSGLNHRRTPTMVGTHPYNYLLLLPGGAYLAGLSAAADRVASDGAPVCCAEEARWCLRSRLDLLRAHRARGLEFFRFS